jgi:internalin A
MDQVEIGFKYEFADPEMALAEAEKRIERAVKSGSAILNLELLGLTEVPESIGRLKQLQRLSLRGNQLTALPEVIGELKMLRMLVLSENPLTALPQSLRKLTALKHLYLDGNALDLPAEVLQGKPAEVLDYYFRLRLGRRPLNEARLVLVGRSGTGKTSLVNRLVHDRFRPEETHTEGIGISKWKLGLPKSEVVRLHVWDFGGQETLRNAHQFFLTPRSLYLLVLEGRHGAEEADAEYWLQLIASFGKDEEGDASPVLLVLNKAREKPFDLNRHALQEKYPFIRGFVATDCSDRTGLHELLKAIAREADQLKYLRADFPASWFAIKDQLARMKEKLKCNFISYGEYRSLCAKNGEPEDLGQEKLAKHLHHLGIALHYKDDPRLCDTHVLDPHWVIDGIYKVLHAPLLAKQKGELRQADLAQILDVDGQPLNSFLFNLMRKFQLCFPFPDDDTHYLVPDLLDEQEPVEAAAFRPADCLNFEYRYSLLPEGLLPCFIVRTHSMSASLPRWRTGVILEFEGNRALIKADVQNKRVLIAVNGPAAGRRRLLAVIRSDFEGIHAEINKPKPKAFVPLPGFEGEAVPYEDLLLLERASEPTFKKPVKDGVVEIDLAGLLNGTDLKGAQNRETAVERAVRLLYSYSFSERA